MNLHGYKVDLLSMIVNNNSQSLSPTTLTVVCFDRTRSSGTRVRVSCCMSACLTARSAIVLTSRTTLRSTPRDH